MFTGLIEEIGIVQKANSTTLGKIITINAEFMGFQGDRCVKIGDSIAVDGVCQTVIACDTKSFTVEAMNETLKHSNFKDLKAGTHVNLERAMKITDRFDGHIVTGHIDTVAKLENICTDGFSKVYKFSCPDDLIVQKGSIAINGISLTVSNVAKGTFEVSLIPHTLENTNLKHLKTGGFANIEYDIMAKYLKKFTLSNMGSNEDKAVSRIDEKFLIENGF